MQYFINSLTFARIVIGPIIYINLVNNEAFIMSLLLFTFASISDYLDGFFARKYNLTSDLGEIIDPIADKILILFSLFALALYLESIYIGFMGCIILAREFWVSALRDLNARSGNPVATKVTFLAKLKTAIQLISIGLYLLALSINSSLLMFIADFNLFAACIITIHTGFQYSIRTFKLYN